MIPRLLLSIAGTFIALSIAAQSFTIQGHVSDVKSGESLLFSTIYVEGTATGVQSNEYGFYSITLAEGSYRLVFKFLGYEDQIIEVTPQTPMPLNVKMAERASSLREFEVSADKPSDKVDRVEMSTMRMDMKQMKALPAIGGETDIIKVMQLLPGVSPGGEGGTSMFVRGGDADQNLVLLDEATVYNISHLFGFFSVFNPDVVQGVSLVKGAFPAQYGGRLSSILDVRTKDGNDKKFHGQGGVGLLSSRLALEGPIVKDKVSFMISGRRTYIDQVFKAVGLSLPYFFYDINAKLNFKISDKDRVYISTYYGNDVLALNEEIESDSGGGGGGFSEINFGYKLGNMTNTVRWNHLFSDRLFANFTAVHTAFSYEIEGEFLDNSIFVKSNIRDVGGKADFHYYYDPETHIRFGLDVTQHWFRPNIASAKGEITEIIQSSEGQQLNATEGALYAGTERNFEALKTKLLIGGRQSFAVVANGKTYTGFEPRLGLRYLLHRKGSIKASYSIMRQYVHRVSSSSIALPTDLWYPVTENVKPQRSHQIAAGYIHSFEKLRTVFTVEVYQKWMNNLIEYREGANLILNDNFEDELVQGSGSAQGIEFLLQREEGRLSGWIGYTLSWSSRQFDEINNGERYYAKYDRRHNLNVVMTLKLSKRWDFSSVFVYMNGARFTPITGQYLVPNATLTDVDIIPIYAERNSVRSSNVHRLDVNFVLNPNPDKDRWYKGTWNVGAYNVYARATPFRIELAETDSGYGYQQPGLFGFIFNTSYQFEF